MKKVLLSALFLVAVATAGVSAQSSPNCCDKSKCCKTACEKTEACAKNDKNCQTSCAKTASAKPSKLSKSKAIAKL